MSGAIGRADRRGESARRGLVPFLLLSVAFHAGLCLLFVRAARGARYPLPRPPVYHVSLVELPAEPKVEPVAPPPPAEEKKIERIPEKPRPRKRKEEKEPPVAKKREPEKKETERARKREEPFRAVEERRVKAASGAVTVEAEDFPFAYYLALIEGRIGGRWAPPRGFVAGGPSPSATVRFEILRNGALRNAHVSVSSGVSFFDHSALRAVLDAGPFPPLPDAFEGDRLGVHFVFRYEE